jgi:PKD repeat protein
VYSTPGTYTVTLTVLGLFGSVVQTKSDLIHALPPPPVPGFSATPTSGVAPLAVQFHDASSGTITSRQWSFGDGASSSP